MTSRPTADPEFDFRGPKTDEEYNAVGDLLAHSFANPDEPRDPRELGLTPEQFFCAFDGDHVASCAGAFDFKVTFNGKVIDMDGVTIVSTDPAYRRKGLVRKTMTQILHSAHERGVPVAILWASMGAIYQRFGYGYATHWNSYSINPKHIVFERPLPDEGFIRRILNRHEAVKLASEIYSRSIEGHTLSIVRTNAFWKFLLPEEKKKARDIAVYFDNDGNPTGFMIYKAKDTETQDGGPYQIINVSDFIWTDMAAYRGMWNFLAAHDLAKKVTMIFRPDDDPANTLFLEPRALRRRVSDGVWLRIVDIDKALEGRGYDFEGEVTFTVSDDDICPWNNGTWTLKAKDGHGNVTQADPSAAEFEITTTAMASLLCGYSTASELYRSGRITNADEAQLRQVDVLFSTRFRPNCTNMF